MFDEPTGDMGSSDLGIASLGLNLCHGYGDVQSIELGNDAGIAVSTGVLQALQGLLQRAVVGIETVTQ